MGMRVGQRRGRRRRGEEGGEEAAAQGSCRRWGRRRVAEDTEFLYHVCSTRKYHRPLKLCVSTLYKPQTRFLDAFVRDV
jgi:hypothetical protein